MVDVVFERIEVVFDDPDQSDVGVPVELRSGLVGSRSDTLCGVGIGDTDEGEDFLHI